ncbi:MAG: hypothetical protein AAB373_02260 [Patescibacteria group bacterium]
MKHKIENQLSFSSILFDTLFCLVIYFNIDSFLDMKEPLQIVFYVASLILTVHRWMLLKSAADIYDSEVNNSTLNILFGIVRIVLVEHVALLSKNFEYLDATLILVALTVVDLIWDFIWRFVGKWSVKNYKKIRLMENELNNSILIDTFMLILFSGLALSYNYIPTVYYVALFLLVLTFGISLSYRFKIIDLKFF